MLESIFKNLQKELPTCQLYGSHSYELEVGLKSAFQMPTLHSPYTHDHVALASLISATALIPALAPDIAL